MNRKTRLAVALLAAATVIVATSQIAAASISPLRHRHAQPSATNTLFAAAKLNARTTTKATPPKNVKFAGETLVVAGAASGEVVLADVPAYKWRDGCAPTAVGMVIGYWDAHGYPDLASGEVTVENVASQQMIASHGTAEAPRHYEDYALPKEASLLDVLPDRSEAPAGDEHATDCVADFMHTSWSSEAAAYAQTWTGNIPQGFVDYVKSRYPGVAPSCTTEGITTLTWDAVKAEIDAGFPMVFGVDTTKDARMDHLVTVIGYRDVNGYPEYACWDTWSTTLVRWQQFRAMSTEYAWGVWGATTFRMDGASPDPDPTPTPSPTPTPTPTPPPAVDSTAPVTVVSGADDAWHQSSVDLTFTAADDLSGVAYTEVSIDGGPWAARTSLSLTVQKKRGGVSSGVHTVAYRSCDFAGNLEAVQSVQVKLDASPPITSSNADTASHVASFTLVLTPIDTLSGAAATQYAVDGRRYKSGTSVEITGKGAHTVRFYSIDAVGNTESVRSCTVTIS